MTVATSSTVGVRDLKNHLSSHLDRVKAGEEVTVTEHGRPIARLSPIGPAIDRMAKLVEAGIVRPPAKSSRHLPNNQVKVVGGAAWLAETVAEQRR